jgi:hypothetical protein
MDIEYHSCTILRGTYHFYPLKPSSYLHNSTIRAHETAADAARSEWSGGQCERGARDKRRHIGEREFQWCDFERKKGDYLKNPKRRSFTELKVLDMAFSAFETTSLFRTDPNVPRSCSTADRSEMLDESSSKTILKKEYGKKKNNMGRELEIDTNPLSTTASRIRRSSLYR